MRREGGNLRREIDGWIEFESDGGWGLRRKERDVFG